MVISQPIAVEQFPHLSSISSLNFIDIPISCKDWQWLAGIVNLRDFRVSVRGTDTQSGSLHVCQDKADLKSVADTSTVSKLITIMSHLKTKPISFNASIQGSAKEPGCLQIANDEAILKYDADIEMTASFAHILSHLPVQLRTLDSTIYGSGTIPCNLYVASNRAQLTVADEDETLLAIVDLLAYLPENMRKMVNVFPFTMNITVIGHE